MLNFSLIFLAPPSPNMWCLWSHPVQIKWLMFSTTPMMGTFSFSNMPIALTATLLATSWGVVTTSMPVIGMVCASVSGMSPVPGGRSTTR